MEHSTRKNIILLGATGSIGENTLKLVEDHPKLFKIIGVSAHNNITKMINISNKFSPKYVAFSDESINFKSLKNNFDSKLLFGSEGLKNLAAMNVDIIINGITGFAGLAPTLTAIESGTTIAIANKESIVSSGPLLMKKCLDYKSKIIPIDSEHNAIFQLMNNIRSKDIQEITITASGGPFLGDNYQELSIRSPEEALMHPKWKMGPKNSIDSATLMNKALELIEASILFTLPHNKINVLVHPEAMVHGMIHLNDGSVFSYISDTDMRIPIFNALNFPTRKKSNFKFPELSQLNFYPVNDKIFPSITFARKSLNKGFIATTMLNAANEIAVKFFLRKRISFCSIFDLVDEVITQCENGDPQSIDEVFQIDKVARDISRKMISKLV